MSKPFHNLLKDMSASRRKAIKAQTLRLKHDMALCELRQALDMTQTQLAESLNMKQAAISKFERQSDIYISTLRRILSAMGADLKIVARFPEGDVQINQFDDVRRGAQSTCVAESHESYSSTTV